MKCETLLQYLSEYIDNNLEDDLVAEAKAHLATCRNCSVVLDSTQKAILLCREQGKRIVLSTRRDKLFSQIEAAFRQKS